MPADQITRDDALSLLHAAGCPQNVIDHSRAVADLAEEIARCIRDAGHAIDVDFVATAALLHDIGRGKTHGVDHGIAGEKLLAAHPRHARVAACHLGAGLTKKESRNLGLPARDYQPATLEEKVIAHADNLIFDTQRVSLDDACQRLQRRIGPDHPAVARMRQLAAEIDALAAHPQP